MPKPYASQKNASASVVKLFLEHDTRAMRALRKLNEEAIVPNLRQARHKPKLSPHILNAADLANSMEETGGGGGGEASAIPADPRWAVSRSEGLRIIDGVLEKQQSLIQSIPSGEDTMLVQLLSDSLRLRVRLDKMPAQATR